MPKFIVNRETTLFRPVEIEYFGKTFMSGPLSPALLRRIDALEREMIEGKRTEYDTAVEQLGAVFGVEPKNFDGIDIRDVKSILDHISKEITTPGEKYKGPTDEKNLPEPGGAPSQS